MKINPFLGLLLALFSSCHVGPRYLPPAVDLPSEWKAPSSKDSPPCFSCNIDYWWEIFQDEVLNELEKQAVQSNCNLEIAYEKIIEARGLAGLSRSDLYPHLNLAPNYSDTGSLFQINLPSTSGNSSLTPLATALQTPFRVVQMLYMLPLNLNYEVDLWGKLRDQYKADKLTAEAQEQAYLSLLLSLTADLASNYFQMRALDSQLDVLEKLIETSTNFYNLTQARFKRGLVTELDVYQSETSVANARAIYHDTQRLRALAENQIAVLAGRSASEFSIPRLVLNIAPPTLPADIPSTILMQRPDIAEAERNLAASNARIGVAYASYFPSLSLTGALGYSSPDLRQFLQWISRYWMLGASSNQVVWDAGRLDSNFIIAASRFRQASKTYQQQVLTALQEVENALTTLEQREKQYQQLVILFESNRKSLLLLKNRYEKGLSTSLDVATTQINELNAELQTANLLGLRYVSTIELIKAFGGRW